MAIMIGTGSIQSSSKERCHSNPWRQNIWCWQRLHASCSYCLRPCDVGRVVSLR